MFCNNLDPNYKLIYSKKLIKQTCFYEEDGEPSEPVLRQGIIKNDLYKNRKYISTINGKSEFNPLVEIYSRVYTDNDGTLILNVWDVDRHQVIKQIIINTKPNNFNINNLKSLHDSFKTICESDSTTTLIDLLKKIKYEFKNLKFEEYC